MKAGGVAEARRDSPVEVGEVDCIPRVRLDRRVSAYTKTVREPTTRGQRRCALISGANEHEAERLVGAIVREKAVDPQAGLGQHRRDRRLGKFVRRLGPEVLGW